MDQKNQNREVPSRAARDNRTARLSEALRDNLRKRKAQERARTRSGDDVPAAIEPETEGSARSKPENPAT